ncbi:vWA domain-containing protein [Bacillus sp. J33]|uniref:vWA domain-containing protein n=1 Tax=Bacillus sp. J33 TaxID=935836 RepID=UPI00047BE875|nr:VWA domain-containing protein [Bacillus sp. J33]
MRRSKLLIVVFLYVSLILAGCNQDTQNKADKDSAKPSETSQQDTNQEVLKKDKESQAEKESGSEVKVDPLPSTYEELASRPVGEQHDFTFMLNEKDLKRMFETFKDLPDISNSPTYEELDYFYQELLVKMQQDFRGPEEAIRQLRFQTIGDPEMENTRYQFKENLNVEILLDASGSMAGKVNGKIKMDAAKESISKFVQSLPKEANVGIRVYGHKGTGSDKDKTLSCSSSEMMYPISAYDESSFQSALNKIAPSGWTPIELAINEAKKDLANYDGESNTNIVYLVSDGVSTCDDDPVKAAKQLYDSNIAPIINVIGFDVDSEGQNQLKRIADTTEGLYAQVSDGSQLNEELSKLNDLAETWEKWKEQGIQSLDYKKVNNSIDIFVYITKEESKAINEKTKMNLIMSQLWQKGLMDKKSYQYLEQKNNQYHDWILEEIEKFDQELKDLNEKSYAEALKTLEERYQQSTQ